MNQIQITELELRNKILYRREATTESLSVRPLELNEVKKFSSLTYLWHQRYNSENLELALTSEQRKIAGKQELDRIKAKKLWAGELYDEAAFSEVYKFRAQYQQFDGKNAHNVEALLNYLKENSLPVTLNTLVDAFEKLTLAGKLTLLPEAIGLPESTITGYALQHYKHLATMLEPHPIVDEATAEQQRISKMSADEYKREFIKPEVSQREVRDNQRIVKEFENRHPEFEVSEESWLAITEFLLENKLGLNYNSLELAIHAPEVLEKLRQLDKLWDTTRETPYHGQISTLVDRRLPKGSSVPAREVTMDPLETPKRITLREVLSWSADRMQAEMLANPNLQKEIDNL